jgi:hypothetical protein
MNRRTTEGGFWGAGGLREGVIAKLTALVDRWLRSRLFLTGLRHTLHAVTARSSGGLGQHRGAL